MHLALDILSIGCIRAPHISLPESPSQSRQVWVGQVGGFRIFFLNSLYDSWKCQFFQVWKVKFLGYVEDFVFLWLTSELKIAPRLEQAWLVALSSLLLSAMSTNISRYLMDSSIFPWLWKKKKKKKKSVFKGWVEYSTVVANFSCIVTCCNKISKGICKTKMLLVLIKICWP